MALPALQQLSHYSELPARFVLQRNKCPLARVNPTIPGAHTAPENQMPLDEALRLASLHDCGIGYSASNSDVVLDFDNAVTGDKIKDWALGILSKMPSTLIEISPSGKGLHAFLTLSPDAADLVRITVKTVAIEDGKVEFLRHGFYSTVTGNVHPNYNQPIAKLDGRGAARLVERIRLLGKAKPAASVKSHTNADYQRVLDAEIEEIVEWRRMIASAESFDLPTFNLIGWALAHGTAADEIESDIYGLYDGCELQDQRWKDRRKTVPDKINRWSEFLARKDREDRIRLDYMNQFTEAGNVWLLEENNKDHITYISDQGWAFFNGKHYEVTNPSVIQEKMFEVILPIVTERGLTAPDRKSQKRVDTFKTACHKNTVRVGTEKIALGRMRSNGARYDADPSLLNCPSGIIDLRLGSRFDHNPEFYLTYMANVDPVEGPTPYYDKFMKDIFLGDKDLIEYYKCLKGYSLTGETKEHKFIVLYGDGGNGKSTDLKLEKDMLGTSDYAPDNYGKKYFQTLRADSLLAKNGLSDDKGNDIAVLHKCRFCSVSELGEQKIKGERLKALASGDELQIRLNYQEFYNSTLQVKIWIQTNFKPNIRGDDEAIWRRAILIPFKANFRDNPDKDLSAKLRSEAPAVLAERIRYAKQWYKMGLPDMPSSLTAELDTWRSGADPILQFTQDCIVKTGHGDVLNSEIHAAYVVWCRQSGIEPLPMQKVSERMLALGFEKGQFYRKGMNLQRGFKNIALVAKAIEYDADEI